MNWNDISSIVGKVAPALGALLAVPTGGASLAIGQAIASALGTDSTPEAVAHAIQNDPQSAVKLQELNNQHAEAMAKIEADKQVGIITQQTNEAIATDNNITQRWLSDNTAGGLPAITRPLLVWVMFICYIIMALTDGNINGFHIRIEYINTLDYLMPLAISAYFGLRTYEKAKGVQHDDVKIVK